MNGPLPKHQVSLAGCKLVLAFCLRERDGPWTTTRSGASTKQVWPASETTGSEISLRRGSSMSPPSSLWFRIWDTRKMRRRQSRISCGRPGATGGVRGRKALDPWRPRQHVRTCTGWRDSGKAGVSWWGIKKRSRSVGSKAPHLTSQHRLTRVLQQSNQFCLFGMWWEMRLVSVQRGCVSDGLITTRQNHSPFSLLNLRQQNLSRPKRAR